MLGKLWLRHWYFLSIVIIVVVAAILRFYQLGSVPEGMTWDEAAIAYNGYAVITTRRDEWLQVVPISFRSYGDYKAPLAIYVVGLLVTFLGSEIWVVRLPFALAGVAAVVGMILLTRELFESFEAPPGLRWLNSKWLGLVSGLILTFSPWHLHYSRLGFESGLAMSLVIWIVYFFLRFIASSNTATSLHSKASGYLLLSTGLAGVSMYSYHSTKMVVPLLGIFLLVLYRKFLLSKKWLPLLLSAGLVFVFLLIPLVYDSFFRMGGERFIQASVFGLELPLSQQLSMVVQHYFRHFSWDFLIGGFTETLRHGDGKWGVLFFTTLLLVMTGLVTGLLAVIKRNARSNSLPFIYGVFWTLIGILPAAIGRDVPHSNRALLVLPGLLLIAVFGLREVVNFASRLTSNKKLLGTHQEKNMVVYLLLGTLLLIHSLLFIKYTTHYYQVFAKESSADFMAGYIEMFEYVKQYEKGTDTTPKVDKIVVSSRYGQPYMYALFVKRLNPIWYQGGSLNTYFFLDKVNVGDLERKNTVVVATDEDLLTNKEPVKIIFDAAGKAKFRIYYQP